MREKKLFIELNDIFLTMAVVVLKEDLQPEVKIQKKIKLNCESIFDSETKNQIINKIKSELKLVELEAKSVFNNFSLILDNNNVDSINFTGTKKLNGAQIYKEDISHIINNLKNCVFDLEREKKIIHLFNSKSLLDNKEVENLPIGLSGEIYHHQLSFILLNEKVFKDLNYIFGNSNLKIERIILKNFLKGVETFKQKNLDTYINLEIGQKKSNINIFYKSSLIHCENFNFGTDIIYRDVQKICSLKENNIINLISEICFDNIFEKKDLQNFLDEKYFIGEKFRKISFEHIYNIIQARVEEIQNILFNKNINLNFFKNNITPLLINIKDENFLKNFKKMFINSTNYSSSIEIKKTQDDLTNIFLHASDLINNGWSKEALPLIHEKKSFISSIFSRFFD